MRWHAFLFPGKLKAALIRPLGTFSHMWEKGAVSGHCCKLMAPLSQGEGLG